MRAKIASFLRAVADKIHPDTWVVNVNTTATGSDIERVQFFEFDVYDYNDKKKPKDEDPKLEDI